jgi:hypothetical protein
MNSPEVRRRDVRVVWIGTELTRGPEVSARGK